MSKQAAAYRGASGAPLPRELNLGCGLKQRENCLNVDRVAGLRPELVWDLDKYPYPLPEPHFHRIFAYDVIEHVENVLDFMQEAHRLAEPGGILEITTPHFPARIPSWTRPTGVTSAIFLSISSRAAARTTSIPRLGSRSWSGRSCSSTVF